MLSPHLARDLIWVTAAKLFALAALYVLFFTPSHRPTIDLVAQIAGPEAAAFPAETPQR
jgi:hypothetical protein